MSIVTLAAMLLLAVPVHAGVRDSLHNLSASGPGQSKAVLEGRVCNFCHISHSANPKASLWGRPDSQAIYIPYSSSTAIAQPGQPTGTSLLCLSCHDGTIALGQVLNRGNSISMAGGNERIRGKGLTGTDLRDDHPISFEYSASLAASNGELAAPGTISRDLRLDGNGELQCTTCHDAHDSPYPNLLRVSNIGSQICIECHQETGWEQTSHSLSAVAWNGANPNPWRSSPYTTVSDNGCQNCHVPHNEAGGPRLLIHAAEEDNCVDCHNGNVATDDLDALFANLSSSHPVGATTLAHDPTEPAVADTRHIECVDCHDPHATRASRSAGDVPSNVRGVTLAGTETDMAFETYQICLRCHGDSPNQPAPRTLRQDDLNNLRLRIQPDSPSFHPIAGVGRNGNVPSLIGPLNEQSVIACVDCHNSSQARSAGGSGPEGPHGSAFEPILVRNYETLDNTPESASNYALCYGCHSRDSILNNESFKHHDKHVTGQNVPCNACHDPHGISSTQGNEINNSHLINFDTSIVSPNSNNQLLFEDTGQQSGTCNLLCHGDNHVDIQY
jgi:predicted CXXCH cytochrome family protein